MIRIYKNALLILLILLFEVDIQAQSQKFAVIANTNVPIQEINKGTIKRIYNGFTTQWNNGTKIKPCYTNMGDNTFWSYLSTTKANFNKFWTKRVFSGNGVSPIEHQSGEKVINYVNNISGAIGIIPISDKSKIGSNCKLITLID